MDSGHERRTAGVSFQPRVPGERFVLEFVLEVGSMCMVHVSAGDMEGEEGSIYFLLAMNSIGIKIMLVRSRVPPFLSLHVGVLCYCL